MSEGPSLRLGMYQNQGLYGRPELQMRMSPPISSTLEEAVSKAKKKDFAISRENFEALVSCIEARKSRKIDYSDIIKEMKEKGYNVSPREIDFVYSFLSI